MTHPFDPLETTDGDGGDEGFARRRRAWPQVKAWLQSLDADDGQQRSLFEETSCPPPSS